MFIVLSLVTCEYVQNSTSLVQEYMYFLHYIGYYAILILTKKLLFKVWTQWCPNSGLPTSQQYTQRVNKQQQGLYNTLAYIPLSRWGRGVENWTRWPSPSPTNNWKQELLFSYQLLIITKCCMFTHFLFILGLIWIINK